MFVIYFFSIFIWVPGELPTTPAVWAVAGPSGDFVVGNARSTRLYEEQGHGLKISIEKGDCPIVSYSSSVVSH